MTNKSYAAGRRAEYKCIEHLREAGWSAVRTAGSHGPFDVVAWTDHQILFIQVKKVCALKDIPYAVEQANTTFDNSHIFDISPIRLETWVRLQGYWYIYTYPFVSLERRIK